MSELVRRLELGDWAYIMGSASILLFVSVFLTIAVRNFLLPKASMDRMAALPLDDPPAADPGPPTPAEPRHPH